MRRAIPFVAAALLCATELRAQGTLLDTARKQIGAGRYADAAKTYRRLLLGSPSDTAALAGLVESLDAAGQWKEALPYLDRLVASTPPDVKRFAKLAQYLAWTGERDRAEKLFKQAYSVDSSNATVLAAYGDYLSWSNSTRRRGIEMLRLAIKTDPQNPVAREALANAELDAGHYPEASRLVEPLGPSVRVRRGLRDSVTRATNWNVSVDGMAERRTNQLDAEEVRLSAARPIGYGRVAIDGAALRFTDGPAQFDLQRGALSLSYLNPAKPQFEAKGAGWIGDSALKSLWEASVMLRTPTSYPVGLELSVDRSPVRESQLSFLGMTLDGIDRGAVVASSAKAATRISVARLELLASGTTAMYEGTNLDTNHQAGFSGQLTYVVRSFAPWARIGVEYRQQSFTHNSFDDTDNAARFGGYFSPSDDRVTLGVLQLGYRPWSRLLLEADVRGGRETVQIAEDRDKETRNAAIVNAHTAWRLARSTDFDVSYLYVNVFTAFRMHQLGVGVKRYF
jgi:Flp pilus assembly protein TadD